MAISYNTGTTKTVTNSGSATGTVTIPAGVLNGDVIIVLVMAFTTATGTLTNTLSSTGTSPHQIGSQVNSGTLASIQVQSGIWYIQATATDAGKVLTFGTTGGSGGAYWYNVGLVAYTGANATTPIDNSNSASFNNTSTGTTTTPTSSTVAANDWQIQLLGVAPANGNNFTVPGSLTSREAVTSATNAGLLLQIADSNGSVGPGGTSIGNTTWTCSSSTNSCWSTSFTVALAPAGVIPSPPENPTPPPFPHPLWYQILEASQERKNWPAQGTPSLVPQSWRLMDGAQGRPGTGSSGTQPPSAGTSNAGAITNGTSFYVTQGGLWFQGYWYYCCASGQSTAAVTCALWGTVNATAGGFVVPGSVVTSGTLTAGQFNYIPLPQPVPLALYGVYVAAVGVPASAGYPDTAAQFGATQPYASGIVNGPLAAFSDLGASNPTPLTFGQSPQNVGGSNPAVNLPTAAQATHDLTWLDVQVTNSPGTWANQSVRMWPNMPDSDYLTTSDAAQAYVLATEFTITTAHVVRRIWYYVPPGQGGSGNQWATSADIWRVRDQVRVATQPNPVWINGYAGGIDGNSNLGRWVYTELPGYATLPPGDYKVSVYNGNGSPNQWSAKRLGYWQAYQLQPNGTFLNAPPGAAGIAVSPAYNVPTTPAASTAVDFINNTILEPGQSTFITGPPNAYPNQYVGTPSNLFQNYWIDIELIPASLFTPDAPDLPQRIFHPDWLQILQSWQERRISGNALATIVTTGFATVAGTGEIVPAETTTRTTFVLIAGTAAASPADKTARTDETAIAGTGAASPADKTARTDETLIAGTGAVAPADKTARTDAAAIAGTGAVAGADSTARTDETLIGGTGALSPADKTARTDETLIGGTGAVAAADTTARKDETLIATTGALAAADTTARTDETFIAGTGSLGPQTGTSPQTGFTAITGTGEVAPATSSTRLTFTTIATTGAAVPGTRKQALVLTTISSTGAAIAITVHKGTAAAVLAGTGVAAGAVQHKAALLTRIAGTGAVALPAITQTPVQFLFYAPRGAWDFGEPGGQWLFSAPVPDYLFGPPRDVP